MLSEEEMEELEVRYVRVGQDDNYIRADDLTRIVKDVEAALRAQTDAQPVGYIESWELEQLKNGCVARAFPTKDEPHDIAIYTHPAPEAAQALSDELRDHLVAISAAIADQDDRAAQAMLREILSSASAATVAEPSETDRAVRCLSRKPSEKVKAVYTTWAHENGCRAKTLADRIINDYLLHYDFPTQGQSHMQDCIVSVLSAALTEAPQAAQPAESSDSRDDDAEFRAWREQQWRAGINPTERDAWRERARRERDLLASVATPAVDYTAQQQAEPSASREFKSLREWDRAHLPAHAIETLREKEAIDILTNAAQILDVVKQEWMAEGAWSDFDQSVRNSISAYLTTRKGGING